MSRPFIEMLIGLPGVGKSTYTRDVYPNTPVASSDAILEKFAEEYNMTYNDAFKQFIDTADQMFRSEVQDYIEAGTSFIVDRTNLTIKSRRRVLQLIEQANLLRKQDEKFELRATIFTGTNLSMRDWLTQLDRPGKTIPTSVLIQMSKDFTEPTVEEGFGMFTYISGRDY